MQFDWGRSVERSRRAQPGELTGAGFKPRRGSFRAVRRFALESLTWSASGAFGGGQPGALPAERV